MNRADVALWAALVAAGVAFEVRELREGPNGVPLSRVLRSMFRTSHPAGALVFEVAVLVGSDWLVRHIVSGSFAEPVRNGAGNDATSCDTMTRVTAGQSTRRTPHLHVPHP